jgi:hypothetical protein
LNYLTRLLQCNKVKIYSLRLHCNAGCRTNQLAKFYLPSMEMHELYVSACHSLAMSPEDTPARQSFLELWGNIYFVCCCCCWYHLWDYQLRSSYMNNHGGALSVITNGSSSNAAVAVTATRTLLVRFSTTKRASSSFLHCSSSPWTTPTAALQLFPLVDVQADSSGAIQVGGSTRQSSSHNHRKRKRVARIGEKTLAEIRIRHQLMRLEFRQPVTVQAGEYFNSCVPIQFLLRK